MDERFLDRVPGSQHYGCAELKPGIARVTVAFVGVVTGSKDAEITGEAPRVSSTTPTLAPTTVAPSISAPRPETPSRSTDASETGDGDDIGTLAVLAAITVALVVAAVGSAIFVARRR